jgi:6-phosphofructokinase
VYGARHGVRGIVDEDFVDLTQETSHNLELVAGTPGSALGSTRDKPDLAYCRDIFRVLRAHGIGHFYYIGGNDSADTVRIVSEQAAQAATRAVFDEAMRRRDRRGMGTTMVVALAVDRVVQSTWAPTRSTLLATRATAMLK